MVCEYDFNGAKSMPMFWCCNNSLLPHLMLDIILFFFSCTNFLLIEKSMPMWKASTNGLNKKKEKKKVCQCEKPCYQWVPEVIVHITLTFQPMEWAH